MNNLSIQQFCQIEAFRTDLNSMTLSDCEYREKVEGNLTIVEFFDQEGSVVQELILVV